MSQRVCTAAKATSVRKQADMLRNWATKLPAEERKDIIMNKTKEQKSNDMPLNIYLGCILSFWGFVERLVSRADSISLAWFEVHSAPFFALGLSR